METTVNDSVIIKLQKLLNMARAGKGADAATEAEANVAMAMAQKLMAKHNLSMAMVEASGETVTMGGSARTKEKMQSRAMYKWQQALMSEVAKANFCRHFMGSTWAETPEKWSEVAKTGYSYQWGHEGPNGESYKKGGNWRSKPYHVLVGREVNVVSARHMFDYLCVTIERLVPITSNAQRLSRSAMSWKDGCSDRLQTRLLDRRVTNEAEQAEQAAAQRAELEAAGNGPGTGLAVVTLTDYADTERNANYELMYGLEPGTLAKREQAWEAGREARAIERARHQEAAQAAFDAMTPKQRERHDRKQIKEAAQERARWAREAERERNRRHNQSLKTDWGAYNAGSSAGNSIGLDPQVGGSRSSKGSLGS